jgi:hypothetical protein
LKKHKDELIARYIIDIDVLCKKADSAYKYTLYFEFLNRKMKQYPENIYNNMDEKGFLIDIISKDKRLFSCC